MTFRPTLWATLATLPVLAVLIGLGVWQLQRLDWKEGLIELRAERVVSPIIDLVPRTRVDWLKDPGRFEMRLSPMTAIAEIEGNIDLYEYRPVRLAGEWRHDKAMHLVGRTRDGEVGEHIVTPLALAQGGTVLVDRGWAPPSRGSDTAGYAEPEGRVVVEGHIRHFAPPGDFTPDNEPQNNVWFWLDPEAMAAAAGGSDVVMKFYVQAGAGNTPDALPAGAAPQIALHNPHLGYAFTWFGLAGTLVGVYIAFHIRRRSDGGDAKGAGGDGTAG